MLKISDQLRKAPWLIYKDQEPTSRTKQRIKEALAVQDKYPLSTEEIPYPDDTTPAGWNREDIITPKGIHMHAYRPEIMPAGDDRVIFYIHGGGFMRGNEKWNRQNAITLAKYLGLPVYCCKYRCIPAYGYPAGLDDVEMAWDHLVNDRGISPDRLIVMGESAGGNYALALTARLKAKGKGVPYKIAGFSSYLDMLEEGESYICNKDTDLLFKGQSNAPIIEAYAGSSDRKNPEISPFYADFTGFPPTFLCADDNEIFVSDSLRTAEKMYSSQVPVQCYITHDLFHAFEFEISDVSEAADVFKAVKDFIQ